MDYFFTQSAYVLLDHAPIPDEIHRALSDWGFSVTRYEHGIDLLTAAEASVVFEVISLDDQQTSILVDSMNCPWPDQVTDKEPVLFLSWHSGALGPFVYFGCLERAIQECRTWNGATQAVKRHKALLRLRVAHKKGYQAEWKSKGEAKKYDLIEELAFVHRCLMALDKVSGVLGYFFPGGEALCSRETLFETWEYYTNHGYKPFDLWIMWINRRLGRTPEEPDWAVVDIVGLAPVGDTDLEACFPHTRYDSNQVANWLLNVASYLYDNGPIIEDGHTLTGPGGIDWQAYRYESSLQFPARPILCLRPLDSSRLPRRFLKRLPVSSEK
ncbi:MAG TPA: DUF4261 domain-containing protein [Ktedonobacteraceae bacterium]|nr:DUF4261 domain-containing protein [Ktedonobacteraceae bacterium]